MSAPHSRPPMEHDLKVWPPFYEAIADGTKTFEVRRDDRGFQAGDTLWLREWTTGGGYSGRECRVEVTYLLGGLWPGLQDGFVVMAIKLVGISA